MLLQQTFLAAILLIHVAILAIYPPTVGQHLRCHAVRTVRETCTDREWHALRNGACLVVRADARSVNRLRRIFLAESMNRTTLVALLNEDLAREYQAVIAYVVYSQTLKGAAYMTIAKELEQHAAEELSHAITIAKHIDYLGGTPGVTPQPVLVTNKPIEMLRADLANENETIRQYRQRLKQCEALEEFGIAEDLREILRQEQEHQTDLATALGEEVPDVSQKGTLDDSAMTSMGKSARRKR